MTSPITKKQRVLKGTVVSTKMDKTAVVSVSRFIKDPKYGKYLKRDKRYKAHDPENKAVVGEKVLIREVKPISKDKSFVIVF